MKIDNFNDISPIICSIVLVVWVILCKHKEKTKINMKKVIYKCRVEIDDDGKVSVCSVSNIRIPYSVLMPLNEAVHEAARTINGTNSWKKKFIKFEHDGKKYHQVESVKLCEGCVFHYKKDGRTCQHPYFETKDNCTGRIYKEED